MSNNANATLRRITHTRGWLCEMLTCRGSTRDWKRMLRRMMMATAAAALTIQHITTIYRHLHSITLLLFLHLFSLSLTKKSLLFSLYFLLFILFQTTLLLHCTVTALQTKLYQKNLCELPCVWYSSQIQCVFAHIILTQQCTQFVCELSKVFYNTNRNRII